MDNHAHRLTSNRDLLVSLRATVQHFGQSGNPEAVASLKQLLTERIAELEAEEKDSHKQD